MRSVLRASPCRRRRGRGGRAMVTASWHSGGPQGRTIQGLWRPVARDTRHPEGVMAPMLASWRLTRIGDARTRPSWPFTARSRRMPPPPRPIPGGVEGQLRPWMCLNASPDARTRRHRCLPRRVRCLEPPTMGRVRPAIIAVRAPMCLSRLAECHGVSTRHVTYPFEGLSPAGMRLGRLSMCLGCAWLGQRRRRMCLGLDVGRSCRRAAVPGPPRAAVGGGRDRR
jgi:hypothetical protein